MGKGALMFFLFPEFLQVNKKNLCLKVLHLLSFFFKGHSNTVCEMRVAWVWLLQKASACYCLPSQLLQAPAPWLPYMRDQGLPRCFWERRAQCEGTNQSTKYSFPLHVRCPSGDSAGVTDTVFLFSIVVLNENCCLPFHCCLLPCTVCGSIIRWVCPKESLFRLWLFIRCQTEAPHVEKVKVVLSTSHSCQKSSATEPQH